MPDDVSSSEIRSGGWGSRAQASVGFNGVSGPLYILPPTGTGTGAGTGTGTGTGAGTGRTTGTGTEYARGDRQHASPPRRLEGRSAPPPPGSDCPPRF